ncbi:MAG TPA: hypothetical protein VFS55_07640 [Dokdonella sp.]|nr:hypothetical protein [Dokdonella sp.]
MLANWILLAAFMAGTSATADAPKSNLVVSPCDLGDHMQFEIVECEIALRNLGETPITISSVESSAKADVVDRGTTVPPHGTSYLKARVALGDAIGITKHSFRFKTSERGPLEQRGSAAYMFVSTVLDQGNPTIQLGSIDIEDLPVEKSVELSSREIRDFQVLGVESKPDYVDVAISNKGTSVSLRLRKNAPVGLLHDKVILRINGERQARVAVALDADIRGDVVPDGNPLLLGLMRLGEKNDILIRLTSRSGKPFEITKVQPSHLKASGSVEACTSPATSCKLVRLRVSKDQPLGALADTISIELAGGRQVVPVRIEGLVLAPDTKIHNLNEEAEQRRASSLATSPAASSGVSLSKAISQSVAEAEDAPLPGTGPLLRWVVEHQDDIHGFIIWRADSEDGPSLRVNKEFVPAIRTGSGKYQWRDNSAVSGKTYWYSIGYVKNDGTKVDLSGRQKTTAK